MTASLSITVRRSATLCIVIALIASLLLGDIPAHAQSAADLAGLMPLGLTALPTRAFEPSVLGNGGFEAGKALWADPAGQFAVDTTAFHTGTSSLRLRLNKPPFVPSAVQTKLLKAGRYRLRGWVKGENLAPPNALPGGEYGVRVSVTKVGERWGSPSKVFTSTFEWTEVVINDIIVPVDAQYAVALEAFNFPANGTAWFDDLVLERMADLPVEVFVRYPNFRGLLFDDQPMVIRAGVTFIPPASGGPFTLRARMRSATGAAIAERSVPATNGEITLDASGAPPMTVAEFTIAVVNAAGATVYTSPAYRVARVPGAVKASMNVAVDAKNRVLRRGVPRFILGVYDSGLDFSTGPAFWESRLWSPTDKAGRHMDGLKINTYLNYHYGATPASIMRVMMDSLHARGIAYFQTANCFASGYPLARTSPPGFITDVSDQDVKDSATHPGFAGYYVADECVSEMVDGTFTRYKRLQRLDPTGATLSINVNNLALWRDVADLHGSDSYPLFGAEPAGGYKQEAVAEVTRAVREAVQGSRPNIMVLQFFSFSGSRWPTIAEMRTHAYMAIIEGANGLFWWSLGVNALAWCCGASDIWDATRNDYMNRLRTIVNELATIEPVLLADNDPKVVRSVSDPAVHYIAKTVDGRSHVITANYTNRPVTATFTFSDGTGTQQAYGPYESRYFSFPRR